MIKRAVQMLYRNDKATADKLDKRAKSSSFPTVLMYMSIV